MAFAGDAAGMAGEEAGADAPAGVIPGQCRLLPGPALRLTATYQKAPVMVLVSAITMLIDLGDEGTEIFAGPRIVRVHQKFEDIVKAISD